MPRLKVQSPLFHPPRHAFVLCVAITCGVIFAGCMGEEPIRHYTVEREEVKTTATSSDDLMLVGIAFNEQQAWFFKLVGSRQAVSELEEQYLGFLKSIHFEDTVVGIPRWELPEAWKRKPGSAFRYATLEIPDQDPPLEVAVSTLPFDNEMESYLRRNIDRWRREMGLGPLPATINASDVVDELEGDNTTITLLRLAGAYNGGARGAMNAPPTASRPAPATQPPPADPGLPEYEVPEGWTEGRPTQFSAVSLSIQNDSGAAKITVSDLPAAQNEWADNVIRWAGIVGVPEITPELIDQHTQQVDVGGLTGQRIDLPWPGAAGNGQALTGIMLVSGRVAWFIRFSGDEEMAASQSDAFEAFLGSLKFKAEESNGE